MTVSSNAKILSRQRRLSVPGRDPVIQNNGSNGLNRVPKKKRPVTPRPPPPAPPKRSRKPLIIASAIGLVVARYAGRFRPPSATGRLRMASTSGICPRGSIRHRAQPRRHHPRHDSRRPPWRVRLIRTPAPRISTRSRRTASPFDHASTAAPITLPAHSSLFTGRFPPQHGVRDNGGYFLNDKEQTLAEDAEGPRLRDRRVHRRLRARLEVGHQPGLRHLLRRLRSVEVPGLLDGRDPAAGQRGRGPGAALDRSAPRAAVLRLGPSLRRARAVQPARAVQEPLSGRSLPGGDLVCRLAGRPRRAVPPRPRPLRSHGDRRPRRSRREPERSRRGGRTGSSSTRASCTCRC